MNVLHVVQTYPPSMGGTQEVIRQISERLVADYGDQVTVYTTVAHSNTYFWDTHQPALPQGETWQNGVRVVRFPVYNKLGGLRLNIARLMHRMHFPYEDWARGLYFGPIVPGLRKAIALCGADIVMASAFPLLHMHDALRGAQRAKIPCILLGAFHTEDPWAYERSVVFNDIRECTSYIAYTDFERQYMIQHGIDETKIKVIGGGIDPALYSGTDRKAVRQKLGLGDGLVVISIARHLAHKRLDLLISAMPHLWSVIPDARLVIVGSPGDDTAHLELVLNRLMPEQRKQVMLVGQQSFQEKVDWLTAADVFAMLSNHESFGLVFLEAWASGLPVIGSDAGSTPSVIEHGKDGLLVPYDDHDALTVAILDLWHNPELRTQFAIAGQAKIKARYTWDIVVKRFREAYCSALKPS